jgi:hypothetical protein
LFVITNQSIQYLLTHTISFKLYVHKDDAPKKIVLTQAMRRKQRRAAKKEERSSDIVNVRGYSTDQRISIENMNVNICRLEHQKKEVKMVGLSIQEAAIGRQITSAENRAVLRCPEYDPTNMYWRQVDLLVQQQSEVVVIMNKYNNEMLFEKEDESSILNKSPVVSSFLNQPSPNKTTKRTYTDLVGDDDNVLAFDINDKDNFDEDNVGIIDKSGSNDKGESSDVEVDDISYEVKKEKINKVTKKSAKSAKTSKVAMRVSKRKRKPKIK